MLLYIYFISTDEITRENKYLLVFLFVHKLKITLNHDHEQTMALGTYYGKFVTCNY